MSQPIENQQQPENAKTNEEYSYNHNDVERYLQANLEVESNRHYVEKTREKIAELEHSESVELFQKQVALLQKRLVNDPHFFREMFIAEGSSAITRQFQQKKGNKTLLLRAQFVFWGWFWMWFQAWFELIRI